MGGDNKTRVLWNHVDGRTSLWTLNADIGMENSFEFGPYDEWIGRSVSAGSDGKTRLLWVHTEGRISLWTITAAGGVESTFEFAPF